MIHTFGDSHSYFGWNNIPNLVTHHLGPKLCFSIGRDGINIENGFDVKNGDTVIFCFGEIDCRCHVYKHITREKTYKQVIDEIVDRYFIQLKKAVNVFDNLNVCVYNVVPPVQRHNTVQNPDYPYLGTDEQRKQYVLYFNQKLQEKCNEYGFLFFDVYNNYCDTYGFLNKMLSDGNVHIKNGCHIQSFLKNKQINY